MKKEILFFIILLFLPLIDAVKLGASNSKIELNMSVNKENCKRITIGTDYLGSVAGELKFAKDSFGDKSIGDYNLNPDYFGLYSKYEKNIVFEKPGNKEINICLTGKYPGNYKALLIYKTKNSNAAIGIIINVNIKEELYNKTKIGLFLTPSIFLGFLLFLLVKRLEKSSK